MPQAVDSNAAELDQISARLCDLERRVAALEGQTEPAPSAAQSQPTQSFSAPQRPEHSAAWQGLLPLQTPTGVVPVVGKAVLGIAGAYLLRAIAEAEPNLKLLVLIVAIGYAGLWTVWAVGTHDTSRFASATYAITSVLILAPLLWESTVRFQAIAPIFAGGALVAFLVLALTLSWRRRLQLIPWVATLAVVFIALALIIATHDLVPLTATMLAAAAITEIAACLGDRLSLRAVPALAANFAIWLLVEVMTSAEGVPEGYLPTSPLTVCMLCVSLLAVYGSSIGARSFALRQPLSILEIVQGIFAFALSTYGILRATHGSASWALGIVLLMLSAVFYWGALSYFADESYSRNRRVSASWAAALLLAGSFLVLRFELRMPFFCLAALTAASLYLHTRKFSLGLHASFYLVAATALSSLPAYVASALAGSVPTRRNRGLWIVGVVATVCYLIGARVPGDRSHRQLLWVVPSLLGGCASAAIVIIAISGIAAGRIDLTPSRLSVIRTIVNCVLALALGFAGSRWKRMELGWVAYAAVAFGTLKMLLEDLRFGNAASLVVSLLCYGSILILLPRLTRRTPTGS